MTGDLPHDPGARPAELISSLRLLVESTPGYRWLAGRLDALLGDVERLETERDLLLAYLESMGQTEDFERFRSERGR